MSGHDHYVLDITKKKWPSIPQNLLKIKRIVKNKNHQENILYVPNHRQKDTIPPFKLSIVCFVVKHRKDITPDYSVSPTAFEVSLQGWHGIQEETLACMAEKPLWGLETSAARQCSHKDSLVCSVAGFIKQCTTCSVVNSRKLLTPPYFSMNLSK